MIWSEGTHPPCPAPFNLAEYVLRAGLDCPDKIALAVIGLTGAERWSYARLRAAVLGTATGLIQAGASPGDRVLMRLGNRVEFPITYLAALAVGLIPVPTSAMLTQPEVTKITTEIQPSLIIAEDGVALPHPVACPVIDLDALRDMHALPPAPFDLGDPERPGYIIYTSGTSGVPRAVTHAHRAIWARRMMFDGWYGMRAQDRICHAGAFNWTYTLGTGLMDPWTLGATALIPAQGVTPAQLPLLLKRHDATIFAAAPGVYRQMLRAPIPPLPKLCHGLSAGEKLPQGTRDAWTQATDTPIFEAYGMSECSTFISGAPGRPAPQGTLGYPQPGRRVAVRGGVLHVAADDPGLMLGYWTGDGPQMPDPDWFSTGDTVEMDDTGAVTYLGRRDDMMNAGGFRVSPIEVETAMNTHPDIQESAAVELRVSDTATIIALYYVAQQDLEGLDDFAADRLARYKQPRRFTRIDSLPRGGNGKIQRKALRSMGDQLPGSDPN